MQKSHFVLVDRETNPSLASVVSMDIYTETFWLVCKTWGMVSGMTRWWNRCFVSISITSPLTSLRAKISGCYIRGRWVHNKNASSSFFHDLKHFMSLDRCRWKDVRLNVYYCSLVFSHTQIGCALFTVWRYFCSLSPMLLSVAINVVFRTATFRRILLAVHALRPISAE